MIMYSLTMVRGTRSAFIGLFPSQYRVRVVHCNLEWCESWKPLIEPVQVTRQLPLSLKRK